MNKNRGSCGSKDHPSGKVVIDSVRGDISHLADTSKFMNRSRSLHAIRAVNDYVIPSSYNPKLEKWIVPKQDLNKFYEQHHGAS